MEPALYEAVRDEIAPGTGRDADLAWATLIRRFGSAFNLTPHLHMLLLDGACSFSARKATLHHNIQQIDPLSASSRSLPTQVTANS